MSIAESIERHPVQFLPTGDKALLMAWAVLNDPDPDYSFRRVLAAVLCLEDGSAVIAEVNEFKFDYRYDLSSERWVDVSRTANGPRSEGDDEHTDQEAPTHGSP